MTELVNTPPRSPGQAARTSSSVEPTLKRGAIAALIILLLVNVVGYIDRAALNILQIPIKAELGISDGQIGLLIGLAFFLPYVLAAPVIARLADKSNRKTIIIVGVSFWSLMTGLSGFMSGFIGLLLCRMGVAVGEAASPPSSMSIMSDYFPPSRRGVAFGFWSLSVPIGTMLGIGLGGLLLAFATWRQVFVILGVAGLLFVPIVMFCLRKPPRNQAGASPEADESSAAALRVLWRNKTFRYFTAAAALHMFAMYSLQSWNAPFYVRVHDVSVSQVALYLSIATGVGGAIGSFFGGYVCDLLSCRDERWYAWLPAATTFALVPVASLQLMVPSFEWSIALATLAAVMLTGYLAPMLAMTQAVVPGNLRAFAVSITMVVTSLFGGVFGPLVAGVLSDIFSGMGHGEHALRNAMLASLSFPLGAFLLYLWAAKFLPSAMASARSPSVPEPRKIA